MGGTLRLGRAGDLSQVPDPFRRPVSGALLSDGVVETSNSRPGPVPDRIINGRGQEGIIMRPATPEFDYVGSRGERRYEAWLEEVCRSFCRVNAEPADEDLIDWKINITQISSLSFAQVAGTAGRFLRTRDLLADACDDFVLTSAISATCASSWVMISCYCASHRCA
jgi:hypothetical protein